MENNLKNSIYLREAPIPASPHNDAFGRTDEIMKEYSSASINESARKPSINYHYYERTMMGTFDDGPSYQPEKLPSKTFTQFLPYSSPPVQRSREKIERPCHNTYRALLNEYKLQAKPKVDPRDIERRNHLCERYEERKAGKVEHFKANLLRRIKFEGSDEVESSIQEEIVDSADVKEEKVQSFLKRQQFYAQEKEILRGMREFCQYGAIKIT